MADGDLTCYISREYEGQFRVIKESINNILHTLNNTLSDIYAASEKVLADAKEISSSSGKLASGAIEQAEAISRLDNAVNSISKKTKDTAESAGSANLLSAKSASNAKEGNEEMDSMLESMSGIKDSAINISKIIKIIEDIAFQTNLLALNAAVESARAGEHGKGFAVVAQEVRSLASRSQDASSDTTKLIEDSISRVEQGTEKANATANTLHAIVGNAKDVSDIISAIASSAGEQAKSVSEVSYSLGQINEVVQSNSAASKQSADAALELSAQAEKLKQLVSFFRLAQSKRSAADGNLTKAS
jgi:methyl-accepting chemotaxis protein